MPSSSCLPLPSQLPAGRISFSIVPVDAQRISFTQYPTHTLFQPVIIASDDEKLTLYHWFHSSSGDIYYFCIEIWFTVNENSADAVGRQRIAPWDTQQRDSLLGHRSPRQYASAHVFDEDLHTLPEPPIYELD